MKIKRLTREEGAILGGVCAGMAKSWGFPVWVIRIGFIASSFILNLIVPTIYFVLWGFLPKK